MQKLLVALSVVQTIAIGFLAARVIEVDSRLGALDAGPVVAAQQIVAPPAPAPDIVYAQAAPATQDAEVLRRIIREEFAALRIAAPASAQQAQSPADPRLVEEVTRDLNLYISRGSMNPKEVDLYMDKVLELPEAERMQALRALTKAVNDGRLDARL